MTTQKHTKLGLSVREAGWLLQKTESQIRGMLRRGELAYVVNARKNDPASVRRLLEGDYARLVLDMVLSGDVAAPPSDRRYAQPAPLYPGILEFVPATGFFDPEGHLKPAMDALACLLGPDLPTDERHKSASRMFANRANGVRKAGKSI
jgi:hypothetical protein